MSVSTKRRTPLQSVLRLAILPAVWVERAKGRWRLALLALYGLIAAFFVLLGMRSAQLRRLPNIEEPFRTVNRAEAVPVHKDAYTFYKKAMEASRFNGAPDQGSGILVFNSQYFTGGPAWPELLDADKRWLLANRAALQLWRRGTECDFITTLLAGVPTPFPDDMRYHFGVLALLDVIRLMGEGDARGAWVDLSAILRFVRHLEILDGLIPDPAIEMMIIPVLFSTELDGWAKDERVDLALLRRALDDMMAAESIPTLRAESLSKVYEDLMKAINHPSSFTLLQVDDELNQPWEKTLLNRGIPLVTWCRWFEKNDSEKSRRVAKLVFSNWKSGADRPWWYVDQPVPISPTGKSLISHPGSAIWLYLREPDSQLPLTPQEISNWFDQTLILKHTMPEISRSMPQVNPQLWCNSQKVVNRRKLLAILLAAIYEREHGQPCEGDGDDLVDAYLKSWSSTEPLR